MDRTRTFIITLLGENGEPTEVLGQITGKLTTVGEPNPSRNLKGEADSKFMDYIGQSPLETKELRLRIADIERFMPTYDGRWTVGHIKSKGDNWVEIMSQGKITSAS